jgi:putative ABC transport system substrate-binding protein
MQNPFILGNRTRLVELSLRNRLPTISGDAAFAASGGLMSYGPKPLGVTRHMASFVDKILRGAKPEDLPVEQPQTFDLVINLSTAQALGLVIPSSLLAQATEIIE